MRYYDLTLTNPKTGAVLKHWTSYPGGQFDPGALNIAFDLPVSVGDIPVGQGGITIEGVALSDLSNAQQYGAIVQNGQRVGGANITLKGGMGAGLPLANPKQQGLLLSGAVFQSWGNWTGTDMALNFIAIPPLYQPDQPGNIIWQWAPGQALQDSLTTTFNVAYPGVPVVFNVSASLATSRLDLGFYATFGQLAEHVQQLTQGVISTTYPGVRMVYQNGQISVFDTMNSTSIVLLQFTDFIGQPTWIEPNTIQVKTVLRGDIQVGDQIAFPAGFQGLPGFVQTQQASSPSYFKYQSAIQGKFFVQQVRHIGNFRDADGGAWATIINAVVIPSGS